MSEAKLYGINQSNRDFTVKESWGKNQFNNAFPVALACYMYSKEIKPVYLKINKGNELIKEYIDVKDCFEINPLGDKTYYSFEDRYTKYEPYALNQLPGIDLVIKNITEIGCECVKAIEIKLTTLPDNTTCKFQEEKYGSELVVRPDTIVYLAYSIAKSLKDKKEELAELLSPVYLEVGEWTSKDDVMMHFGGIVKALKKLIYKYSEYQRPLLMQPVWKTKGKSAILANNCLDIFIWSDFGFTKLFLKEEAKSIKSISRQDRTTVWLFLMLYDFALNGKINHGAIIDIYTYETKNDKAFAVSGVQTNKLMKCNELTKPRITKNEIRNIILGEGQKFLSPERRFDAVVGGDPSVFN